MPEESAETAGPLSPDRFAGRTILFLYSSAHDRYFTHRTSVKTYAAAYAKWGINAVSLDLQSDTFAESFVDELQKDDLLAVHCEQGWGLDLFLGDSVPEPDPFLWVGRPAIAHIRDYPFYPWLAGKCLAGSPNRLLHYTEASASDFAQRYGRPANGTVHTFAPHIYLEDPAAEPEPFRSREDRPIDLLYAGSYTNPQVARETFNASQPDHASLFDDLIDAACHDYQGKYWCHAENVLSDAGTNPESDGALFRDLLVQGNQFIRNERRRLLLHALAPHKLHLVWSGDLPDVALHPDTVVVPGNTFPDTLKLMSHSKAMAICLNNFPCSLSERFLSAMHRGAVVLCHGNVLIDGTFKDGETFLRFDDRYANAADCIEKLNDARTCMDMTERAKTLVEREFSPAVRIEQFLGSIDGFYAGRAG